MRYVLSDWCESWVQNAYPFGNVVNEGTRKARIHPIVPLYGSMAIVTGPRAINIFANVQDIEHDGALVSSDMRLIKDHIHFAPQHCSQRAVVSKSAPYDNNIPILMPPGREVGLKLLIIRTHFCKHPPKESTQARNVIANAEQDAQHLGVAYDAS